MPERCKAEYTPSAVEATRATTPESRGSLFWMLLPLVQLHQHVRVLTPSIGIADLAHHPADTV